MCIDSVVVLCSVAMHGFCLIIFSHALMLWGCSIMAAFQLIVAAPLSVYTTEDKCSVILFLCLEGVSGTTLYEILSAQ
jgi:hypothetical protein